MAEQQSDGRVIYRGGSADGVVIEHTPEVFHTHPQRELYGTDTEAPYELYRNVGEETVTLPGSGDDSSAPDRAGRAWVFEFESAAAQRRLDDDMNRPAASS